MLLGSTSAVGGGGRGENLKIPHHLQTVIENESGKLGGVPQKIISLNLKIPKPSQCTEL